MYAYEDVVSIEAKFVLPEYVAGAQQGCAPIIIEKPSGKDTQKSLIIICSCRGEGDTKG